MPLLVLSPTSQSFTLLQGQQKATQDYWYVIHAGEISDYLPFKACDIRFAFMQILR